MKLPRLLSNAGGVNGVNFQSFACAMFASSATIGNLTFTAPTRDAVIPDDNRGSVRRSPSRRGVLQAPRKT
jgi:hypothetical protein